MYMTMGSLMTKQKQLNKFLKWSSTQTACRYVSDHNQQFTVSCHRVLPRLLMPPPSFFPSFSSSSWLSGKLLVCGLMEPRSPFLYSGLSSQRLVEFSHGSLWLLRTPLERLPIRPSWTKSHCAHSNHLQSCCRRFAMHHAVCLWTALGFPYQATRSAGEPCACREKFGPRPIFKIFSLDQIRVDQEKKEVRKRRASIYRTSPSDAVEHFLVSHVTGWAILVYPALELDTGIFPFVLFLDTVLPRSSNLNLKKKMP